jgi:hypothetical protein
MTGHEDVETVREALDELYASGVLRAGGGEAFARGFAALALIEQRIAELEEALREIAAGPRDLVVEAPDGHPAIVSRDDGTGYAECLAIARRALERVEQLETESESGSVSAKMLLAAERERDELEDNIASLRLELKACEYDRLKGNQHLLARIAELETRLAAEVDVAVRLSKDRQDAETRIEELEAKIERFQLEEQYVLQLLKERKDERYE